MSENTNEPAVSQKASEPNKKSVEQVAQEIVNGDWGENYREAVKNQKYDYRAVQTEVNRLRFKPKKSES